MSLQSPPRSLASWRPDRSAILIGALIALLAGTNWIAQTRSAAQVLRLQAEATRERAELNQRFDRLQGVLDRLGKTVAGDQHPTLAADSGRRAIKDGRWGAGQLYLINAITNDPKNVEHLKTYTNALLGHERPPEEAIDQLASILQMAACHVTPDDVSTVIGLIDRVGKAKDRVRAGDTQPTVMSDAPPTDSLDAEWLKLKAADPNLYQDAIRLTAHLRALENFATTLDEQENASEELTRSVAEQHLRWSEVAQVVKSVSYVDQCLDKLKDQELSQIPTDRAVAIVQAAEAVLPSFWGIHAGNLPQDLQRKIDAYPTAIKERVDKIGLKRSAELVRKIDEALKLAKPIGATEKLQLRCMAIENQVKQAQVLAAQLPSPDLILEAQGKIEKRTQELQKCRADQYSQYQTEVIRRRDEAFRVYNRFNFAVSEGNAINIFHNERLSEIDQALLTPEVGRLFNDVLGKLIGRLGPEALVKIEDEMGTSKKLKLEDY